MSTPHSGDRCAFNALLSLLDEFAFPVENPELLDSKHVGHVTIRHGPVPEAHGTQRRVDKGDPSSVLKALQERLTEIAAGMPPGLSAEEQQRLVDYGRKT